jgi:hypothetical protein
MSYHFSGRRLGNLPLTMDEVVQSVIRRLAAILWQGVARLVMPEVHMLFNVIMRPSQNQDRKEHKISMCAPSSF